MPSKEASRKTNISFAILAKHLSVSILVFGSSQLLLTANLRKPKNAEDFNCE